MELYHGSIVYSPSAEKLAEHTDSYLAVEGGVVEGIYPTVPESLRGAPITELGQNVLIPAYIAGRSEREAKPRALELLATLGLSERVSHKPSELSGGEQQRVAIARALINNPSVLFADEPSGNLDSKTKAELHKLFFQLRDQFGQTIVIVTHDPELAALCDRSLFMRDGMFD